MNSISCFSSYSVVHISCALHISCASPIPVVSCTCVLKCVQEHSVIKILLNYVILLFFYSEYVFQ